jgi:hypothetical protein
MSVLQTAVSVVQILEELLPVIEQLLAHLPPPLQAESQPRLERAKTALAQIKAP